MKRIFLDTNFIIDYFVREDYNGDSEKLMKFGSDNNLNFFISYLTVANFAYIMRKLPPAQLSDVIRRICTHFNVVRNTREQIMLNLQYPFTDFEDGLQYQAAMEANCDCIISRNKKDFGNSKIPVLTAAEFMATTLR
ncbi:MAG: PIN domain-containing protein [Muribaculaceae bacterium]|nr:PIN domain-containing protein [Muribaculaceae bacterium]